MCFARSFKHFCSVLSAMLLELKDLDIIAFTPALIVEAVGYVLLVDDSAVTFVKIDVSDCIVLG